MLSNGDESGGPSETPHDGSETAGKSHTEAPETLRERYARGELTHEEFERKLEALMETESPKRAERRVEREREGARRRPPPRSTARTPLSSSPCIPSMTATSGSPEPWTVTSGSASHMPAGRPGARINPAPSGDGGAGLMCSGVVPAAVTRVVADGIHLLEVGWPEPIGANAYLIDDGEVTLVDAGLPVGRRSLAAELSAAGHGVGDLDRVLVTHYDLDHIGGLRGLDADVPVHVGAADARLVDGTWAPPPAHPKGAFHRLLRRLFPLSGDVRPVTDGDRVGGFRAVHAPGHNPGHTVFLHDDLGAALLGDLVRERDGRLRPPPWVDSYDLGRLAESVDRVASESFEHACVGHGRPVSPDGGDRLRRLAAEL